jgi:hypothetical protein
MVLLAVSHCWCAPVFNQTLFKTSNKWGFLQNIQPHNTHLDKSLVAG